MTRKYNELDEMEKETVREIYPNDYEDYNYCFQGVILYWASK